MSIEEALFSYSDWAQIANSGNCHQSGCGSCGIILCKRHPTYFILKWDVDPHIHTRSSSSNQDLMIQWPNISYDLSIGLANDWQIHENVFRTFQSTLTFTRYIHVPRPFAYSYQNKLRWTGGFGLAANTPQSQSEPRGLMISQRVPPVPLAVWETLINTYCPERSKARSQTALVDTVRLIRLYLGKRRPIRTSHLQNQTQGTSNFFSLSNFKMYFDQMVDIELHVSLIVETMADVLAMMHWKANIDGRAVKFVLGGVPGHDKACLSASDEGSYDNSMPRSQQGQWSHTSIDSSVIEFKGQRVCMWLLDFNQCHKMTLDESGVEKAVDAYLVSDPYYPRPPKSPRKPLDGALPCADSPAELLDLYEDDECWSTFQDRYLATSAELLRDLARCQHLPQEFISRVMQEQMKRFTKRSVSLSEGAVDKSELPMQGEEEWVVVSCEDLPDKASKASKASN